MSAQMPVQCVAFQDQVDNLDLQIGQPQDQFQEKEPLGQKTIYPEQSNQEHLSNEQIATILKGCRLNQRGAQKKLYRNYFSYAMSLALSYSSSYDNAVEIINQAFLEIYRDLKNFGQRYDNTVASFTGWLKKTVANTCIDQIGKYDQKDMMADVDPKQVVIADVPETTKEMVLHK